ncbi:hypothetical protein FUAX_07770 [Fulvitalea axinellae]|uniref:Uncharacterized protein n=2 Tax=Fulvitalea axinellae TaxID=1182444 RepID=A0AAU9CGJ7_9BACT|nr:hypothetical protein FUAX_07770 [Fulvitalea axinellae]
MLETLPSEWYGPMARKHDDGIKRRFVRAGSRRAVIVPVTSGYPHLTIDVEDATFDKRRGRVWLRVSEMHYSKSRIAPRYIFKEDKRSGLFVPTFPAPELAHIIPTANNWLKKAKLDIRIGESPVVIPQTSSPKIDTPDILTDLSEGATALTLAEAQEEEPDILENGDRKKKKRRKKKVKAVEAPSVLDETFLEEQLKFVDFPKKFGVDTFTALPPDFRERLHKTHIRFERWLSDNLITPLYTRYRGGKDDWIRRMRHIATELKTGKRTKRPLEFGKALLARAEESTIPKANEYSLARLVPEGYYLDFSSDEESSIFGLNLRVSVVSATIQLNEIRVTEMVDFTAIITHFLQVVNEPGFFRSSAHQHFDFCNEEWDKVPADKMLTSGEHKGIKTDEMDEAFSELEILWDGIIADFTEHFALAKQMLKAWCDFSADERLALDSELRKIKRTLHPDDITRMLERKKQSSTEH